LDVSYWLSLLKEYPPIAQITQIKNLDI